VQKGDERAYVLTHEELAEKTEEPLSLGGTQILLQGGLHPDLKLSFYEDMLKFIKGFGVHIHGFSPPEMVHFANLNGLTIKETIQRLQTAGLDTIPGGGAEILSDRCRGILSPHKCTAEEWLEVMRAAHSLGLCTSATMMFGHMETLEERVEHLEQVRLLQDESLEAGRGYFTAFIPWTFQPKNTPLALEEPEGRWPHHIRRRRTGGLVATATGPYGPVGGVEYLRMLAVSRIYLDNIQNIQASWVTQGAKIGQLALRFGANDLGSTMIEENVVAAAGVSFRMSKEEMIHLIEDLGYEARQRDTYYNLIKPKSVAAREPEG
jgi:cyclic dehypoxanthinyl futalosine synthase